MHEPPPPLDGLEKNALVNMARNGNKDAFGELMVQWEPYIRTSLHKAISRRDDVDDAYQEIAMSLMVSIEGMKHDNFQGWIRRVIRNQRFVFMNRVMARGERLRTGKNVEDAFIKHMKSREDDPEQICEVLEIQHDVAKVIDQLPGKQRRAMRGAFIENKTYEKIGKEEGVTRQAICTRIQKAKKVLRNSLQHHEQLL